MQADHASAGKAAAEQLAEEQAVQAKAHAKKAKKLRQQLKKHAKQSTSAQEAEVGCSMLVDQGSAMLCGTCKHLLVRNL